MTEPIHGRSSVPGAKRHLMLVTGMSGAGRSTALKALEDCGYEAVDNLPLSLLLSLVEAPSAFVRPLAIGVDIRTRDFGADLVAEILERLARLPGLDVTLLFLDSDDDVLLRRYTETRRRHPLAADRGVADGIMHERRLLGPLRDRADVVLDTSRFAPAEFRRLLQDRFGLESRPPLSLFVVSFAYRNGLPREADLVFDVRFLRNPHYVPQLRDHTGREPQVADYIAADDNYGPFFESLTTMLGRLLPRYSDEGKSYLTIAIGCTGGRHRSVFIAERLKAWLMDLGYRVNLSHRDAEGVHGSQ
ncbi:MAG: RNase adapter RapZ [Alphaproteobacteria bacterium]